MSNTFPRPKHLNLIKQALLWFIGWEYCRNRNFIGSEMTCISIPIKKEMPFDAYVRNFYIGSRLMYWQFSLKTIVVTTPSV